MDLLATWRTILTCQDSLPCHEQVSNKLATSLCCVIVMEFGKRQDTTDTTDFCPCQLVMDLLQICYREALGKLV